MKLLAICPCEKVIFDKRDVPSLISIIQNIEVAIQMISGPELPAKVALPKEWFIYTRSLTAGLVGSVRIRTWLMLDGQPESEIVETSIGVKHAPFPPENLIASPV